VRSSKRWALFMSTETQRTLSPGSHVSEMEVKKSRFIGYAQHAENWSEAQAYIGQVKSEHPKARHWCYGFQCGVNPVSERCSDDGEPTGTAGSPILGMVYSERNGMLIPPLLIICRVAGQIDYSNSLLSFFSIGAIKGEELSDVVCVVVRYFGEYPSSERKSKIV
jgi:putative IMPACT (imprinted ancient) family translation regulator